MFDEVLFCLLAVAQMMVNLTFRKLEDRFCKASYSLVHCIPRKTLLGDFEVFFSDQKIGRNFANEKRLHN